MADGAHPFALGENYFDVFIDRAGNEAVARVGRVVGVAKGVAEDTEVDGFFGADRVIAESQPVETADAYLAAISIPRGPCPKCKAGHA